MPMSIPTKATVSCTQRRLLMVGMTIGLISLSGCQHIQATKSPMPVVVHTREKSPPKPEAVSADALPTKTAQPLQPYSSPIRYLFWKIGFRQFWQIQNIVTAHSPYQF